MPVTRARPPTRQNGTSAPSPAASSRSSTPAHRSTAAASAEPPPSPPPAGMRLVSATWAARPTRGQRPAHEVVVVGRHAGHVDAVALDTCRPSPAVKRQLVGQVERDHLGVDQVIAVGPAAGDPQRQRQLGRGRRPPRSGVTKTRRRRPAGPRPRRPAPRPGLGGDAGRAKASGVTRPASERRSILRRWPNAGAHQREQPLPDRQSTAGGGAAHDPHSTDSTLGRGRNTRGRHPADDLGRRPSTRPSPTGCRRPRRPAPRPAARRPRAAPSPASARSPARRRAGRARAAWRRCRAGWRRASTAGASAEHVGQSSVMGVALDHPGAGAGQRPPRAPGAGGGRPRRR